MDTNKSLNNTKLSSTNSYYSYDEEINELDTQSAEPRKGYKIKNIVLEEDLYALTWVALRESTWKGKKIREKNIYLTPSDYFWIHMNFIIFTCLLLITIILILYEVLEDKGYITSTLTIVVLRVTLVCFAQQALAPEFFQGLFLFRYSIRHPSFFTHPEFAIFIGACQFCVSCIVFSSIICFVCMEEEAFNLVVEFAGLTVIANIDNWLGEAIMFSKIYDEDEDKNYNLKEFNKRIPLNHKMSLIEEEDLTLIDDQNHLDKAHWIVRIIEWLVDLLPWTYCLPFITIIFNYVLPLIRPGEEELEKL